MADVNVAGPSEGQMRLSSVSVFFPCYNDANTIGGLVEVAELALRQVTDDFEIIVVNDASTDNSAEVLTGLQKTRPYLRVVEHASNRGYGGALRSGFRSAAKDYVFYTDGDGQYDPSELVHAGRRQCGRASTWSTATRFHDRTPGTARWSARSTST